MSRTRLIRAAVAASLLAASTAGMVFAAGPETGPDVAPPVIDVPAGLVCAFPLRWDTPVVHARLFTWAPEADATEHVSYAGSYVHVVTNLDSGASVTIRAGGAGDVWFHPDESVDYLTRGHTLVGLFAGDIGGPGFYEFRGRLEDGLDDSATLVAHEFRGTLRDLCAALGG